VADGAAIATKTTDANGYYLFTTLAPGNYIVGVIIPNGYISSSINGGDPDNNINLDDNGQVLAGSEIRGLAITITTGAEPDGNSNNTSTNNSYDFGLLPDCNCINTSGNLLTNGSFENGTTGWTATGGTVTSGTGYVACGSKNGFNNSNGKVSNVYQDVTISAGTAVTFSGFSGTHTPGLTCSPKLSLIFRNASGIVLGQTDINVTRDVDVNFGQLAYYSITAVAPSGTAKVRVQGSISCNYLKMDAFCLRAGNTNPLARTAAASVSNIAVVKAGIAEFSVTVNPNPVTSFFNLSVSSRDNISPVDIRILDIDGRVLLGQKTTGGSNLKIKTEGWKSGMYFVEVTQAGRRKLTKLVKAY